MEKISNTNESQLAAGKAVRMGRIMGPDGRTVIVAFDHGVCGISQLGALAHPTKFLSDVTSAGADCVLVTPGTARRYASSIGKLGLIMRIDGGPTSATRRWNNIRPMLEVADAQRLGADGVVVMGLIGTGAEEESLRHLAAVAAECDRLGMVLIAEMLPGGLEETDLSIEQLAIAAHVAAELGADIIKIPYRGPAEQFRHVTDNCFRPIVVLGGPKREDGNFLTDLTDAIESGAAGVAIGRNVWADPEPARVTNQLVNIVHGDSTESAE